MMRLQLASRKAFTFNVRAIPNSKVTAMASYTALSVMLNSQPILYSGRFYVVLFSCTKTKKTILTRCQGFFYGNLNFGPVVWRNIASLPPVSHLVSGSNMQNGIKMRTEMTVSNDFDSLLMLSHYLRYDYEMLF